MSKIEFDKSGRSFIQIKKENDKISIILSAEDSEDSKNTIVNSVSITRDEFLSLVKDIISV